MGPISFSKLAHVGCERSVSRELLARGLQFFTSCVPDATSAPSCGPSTVHSRHRSLLHQSRQAKERSESEPVRPLTHTVFCPRLLGEVGAMRGPPSWTEGEPLGRVSILLRVAQLERGRATWHAPGTMFLPAALHHRSASQSPTHRKGWAQHLSSGGGGEKGAALGCILKVPLVGLRGGSVRGWGLRRRKTLK